MIQNWRYNTVVAYPDKIKPSVIVCKLVRKKLKDYYETLKNNSWIVKKGWFRANMSTVKTHRAQRAWKYYDERLKEYDECKTFCPIKKQNIFASFTTFQDVVRVKCKNRICHRYKPILNNVNTIQHLPHPVCWLRPCATLNPRYYGHRCHWPVCRARPVVWTILFRRSPDRWAFFLSSSWYNDGRNYRIARVPVGKIAWFHFSKKKNSTNKIICVKKENVKSSTIDQSGLNYLHQLKIMVAQMFEPQMSFMIPLS